MSDTVQFSVVSDPDKWEPAESFQCASQEDAIKAAALFKELHGVIEQQAARIKELEKDAERYRWLQSEAKQVYMHPNAEIDNRMRWEFPVLIALTCINSEVSLNAAIDAARRKANAAILKATGDRLDALNRRAAVEQILFDAAAGKRHLPGPEECRALAMKLGVPDELRDPRFDAMLRGESNG